MLDIKQLKSLRQNALEDMKNLICSNELYERLEDEVTLCASNGWKDITVIFKLISDEKMYVDSFNKNTEVGERLSELVNMDKKDNNITLYLASSLFKPLFNTNPNINTDELISIISRHVDWFKGYGINAEHLGFNPAYIIKIED